MLHRTERDDVDSHPLRVEIRSLSKFKYDVISVLKGEIKKITAATEFDRSHFGSMECA